MQYENRIVLFLDILGFRKHVLDTVNRDKDTGSEIDVKNKIKALYDVLTEMGIIAGVNLGNSLINVTQFSDSIVISFPDNNPSKATYVFEIILKIIVKLMTNNIICRGALSFGKLIHNDKILFGPALVDAYETETKAAMYPRVIMDKNIYDFSRTYTDKISGQIITPDGISEYLKQDLDGKYFVDYFTAANHVTTNNSELIRYYKSLREIIINGRKFQQPDLKVKYGWLKTKYNSFLNQLTKHSLPEEVYKYLSSLKRLK